MEVFGGGGEAEEDEDCLIVVVQCICRFSGGILSCFVLYNSSRDYSPWECLVRRVRWFFSGGMRPCLIREFMQIHSVDRDMGRTSIPCDQDTRDRVSAEKQEGETWDACLNRLVDQMPASDDDTSEELDDVMAELDHLKEKIENMDGDGPSMNEIREAIRKEISDQFKTYMQ